MNGDKIARVKRKPQHPRALFWSWKCCEAKLDKPTISYRLFGVCDVVLRLSQKRWHRVVFEGIEQERVLQNIYGKVRVSKPQEGIEVYLAVE